jgi:hypothetical protein
LGNRRKKGNESKPLLIIAGIRNDGIREILGARIADFELNSLGKISSRIWRREG